jgi:hypothetical protein
MENPLEFLIPCYHQNSLRFIVKHILFQQAGRSNIKETKIVGDMIRNLIKAKNILFDLKGRRKNNMTVAKQTYNACHRYKMGIRGFRTKMQE